MNTYKIPFFGLQRQYKNLREELLHATDLAMRDGILVDGKYAQEFADWLKERTGAKYVALVHSGTQALEMIANYWHSTPVKGNQKNHVISIPNISYPATLNAFKAVGWDIVLVDTDRNGIMLSNEITTEWICEVGLYGANPPSYNGHAVITDGAQHWLNINHSGFGNGIAVSFDPTKNLSASGNGGAVLTDNWMLYNYVLESRDNCKPSFERTGSNSKLSEIDCSHLLVRTSYIDAWQKRRRAIREFYLTEFNNIPLRCLSRGVHTHMDQKFVVYNPDRDGLKKFLEHNGIETKIHYPYALSELPVSSDIEIKPTLLSTSVMLTRGVLSLPIHPELTDGEVEIIASKVKEYFTLDK